MIILVKFKQIPFAKSNPIKSFLQIMPKNLYW